MQLLVDSHFKDNRVKNYKDKTLPIIFHTETIASNILEIFHLFTFFFKILFLVFAWLIKVGRVKN